MINKLALIACSALMAAASHAECVSIVEIGLRLNMAGANQMHEYRTLRGPEAAAFIDRLRQAGASFDPSQPNPVIVDTYMDHDGRIYIVLSASNGCAVGEDYLPKELEPFLNRKVKP